MNPSFDFSSTVIEKLVAEKDNCDQKKHDDSVKFAVSKNLIYETHPECVRSGRGEGDSREQRATPSHVPVSCDAFIVLQSCIRYIQRGHQHSRYI